MKMIRGVVGRLGGGRCTLGFVVTVRRGILRVMWVSWGSWGENWGGNMTVGGFGHTLVVAVVGGDMVEAIFEAAGLAVGYSVVEYPNL